jgi:hypothetical protein
MSSALDLCGSRCARRGLPIRVLAGSLLGLMLLAFPREVFLADSVEPKSTRMACGTCPSGYAVTGVTTEPSICKDQDSMLVQCVPLGANLLSVCGVCPEGYTQIGSSSVPARCGNTDGGHMSQCQLAKLQNTLPDPHQGGIFCPPNCTGQTPTPGQGTLPSPPKFIPPPKDSR